MSYMALDLKTLKKVFSRLTRILERDAARPMVNPEDLVKAVNDNTAFEASSQGR